MCQEAQEQEGQTHQTLEPGKESPDPVDPKMIGAVKVSEMPEAPPVLGKCCGLDVHKKTCTAAIISDEKLPILL
jgi:hypothetical protein